MVTPPLPEDLALLRDTVRDYAEREVRPAIEAAERDDGGHLTPEDYRRLVKSAAGIGLSGLLLPPEYGGGGASCLANAVVQEELGAVDVGFASSLNLTMAVPALVVAGGTEAQRSRWLTRLAAADDEVLAGALNEPSVAGSELFDPAPAPGSGLRARAMRAGEGWVLSGSKAGWVSNAGVATTYLVFARIDGGPPSVFWVPADTPGLSVGPRTDLLGLRSCFHAELFLDDVRLPADALIGGEGEGLPLMMGSTAGMAVGLAAAFVGLARTAYETSLAHAGARTSWGRPIREHQAVALPLADAAVDLMTARLLVREAAAAIDRGAPPADLAVLVPAAKTHAVDVAIANAERAVRIHGGAGVTKGVGAEKFLRDAWTGYSCDFTRDMLRLGITAVL